MLYMTNVNYHTLENSLKQQNINGRKFKLL